MNYNKNLNKTSNSLKKINKMNYFLKNKNLNKIEIQQLNN